MSGFVRIAENVIKRIENLKISTFVLILYFFFLISLRDVFEQIFFEESYSIYQFCHHFFFYILVLMAGILVISHIGKTEIKKATLTVSVGFILILIPPLIDRLIFSRSSPYEYILPGEFLESMSTYFLFTPKAGLGILLEIAAILLLASSYVLLKTKSVWRAFLTAANLYLMAGLSVTPRLYLPIPDMKKLLMWQHRHVIYFCFYFVLSMMLGLFFLYRTNKNLPKAIFKELNTFRTLHFILMVIAGVYVRGTFDLTRFPDFLFISLGIILMVLLWLSTLLVNSVFDLQIDKISNPNRPLVKGWVSSSAYLNLSFVISIIAALLSLTLGLVPFIITIISLLSSLAYSMPPLRLRKKLISCIFIGWGSSLAFFLGYFNRVKIEEISINGDTLFLALLIFTALSIGPMTKDFKDYEGDLQFGVKTFFTVYGLEKGRRIVSSLLCLSLLIPIFLFHKVFDVIFFVLASVSVSLLFYSKARVALAYLGYGIVFFYCAFRIMNFI